MIGYIYKIIIKRHIKNDQKMTGYKYDRVGNNVIQELEKIKMLYNIWMNMLYVHFSGG